MAMALRSRLLSTATSEGRRPIALFLNAARLDYDNLLNWSRIQACCDFRRHDTDYVRDKDEMIALVKEHQAEIIITKEMKVPADAFKQFPSSVKILCEAGTGRIHHRQASSGPSNYMFSDSIFLYYFRLQ